jgi:hypothetical protein
VLAGAVVGIAIMLAPALILAAFPWPVGLGSFSRESGFLWGPFAAYAPASPLDAVVEVVWLVLPALVVILALYWLAAHRTNWAGQDEAAKWSRR